VLECLQTLWVDDSAQDMVEYTLLIAMVALAAAAIFSTSTQSMGGIWQHDAATLNAANAISSGIHAVSR
jgi:Flp pilus assembly pilin Flp